MARSDRKNGRAVFRSVLKDLGALVGNDRYWIYAMYALGDSVLGSDLREYLIDMSDDGDRDVARGAARLLIRIGMPAQEASGSLLNMMREDKDVAFRMEVAGELGSMVANAHLKTLETLLEQEQSYFVKRALASSIRAIRLERIARD